MRRRLLGLALLAACHANPAAHATTPMKAHPGAPVPVGVPPVVAVKVEAPAPKPPAVAATVAGRRRGVPPFAQITAVVVDRAGTRALSLDGLGGVRIWPALDGSIEPQVVPAKAPAAMAIAAHGDGSLVGLVDGSGIASLIQLDREGLVRSTATLPPDVTFSGLAILDGGDRVIAVRADQRIVLLDADGVEHGHLALRASRVLALHPAGDRVIALLEVPVAGQSAPTFRLRALSTKGDALAWDGDAHDLPAPVAKLPQIASALSPDGDRFGYMAQDKDAVDVRVVRVDTGAEIALDAPASTSQPTLTTLGWTDDDHLELSSFNAGWRIEIAGDHATAIGDAQETATSVPAFGRGVRVAGYQASLVLRRDGGDVAYLGDTDLVPSYGAMSDDGSVAAWTTSSGSLVVQRFDGSADVRIKGVNDWFASVAFVDDDHVLAGRSDGRVALLDTRTGAEQASMVVAASTPYFFYEARTHLLAVMRDTGMLWVVAVDPGAAKPFGAPEAIGDGGVSFTLLDPDLADGAGALLTYDANSKTRRYSMKVLADGVTTAEIKAAVVDNATPSAYGYDRAGDSFTYENAAIAIRRAGAPVTQIPEAASLAGVYPAPRGDRIAVLESIDSGTSLRVVDRSGKTLWKMAARAGVSWVAWSADESKVLVVAPGGGLVLDGATGAVAMTAYGWSFGLSNQPPLGAPPGVDPGVGSQPSQSNPPDVEF